MTLRLILCFMLLLTVHQQQPRDGKKSPQPTPTPTPTPSPTPPVRRETTAQWLLRFIGVSASPSAMRGEADQLAGDLWLHDLQTNAARRVTRAGGYRSPILLTGGEKALALKGDALFEIALGSGEATSRGTIPGIVKLIGVNAAGANQVLFLRSDGGQAFSAGALSLADGRIEARKMDSNSEDDRRMLAHLRGWDRSYDDGRIELYTRTETREGLGGTEEWRDVYLKRAGQDPFNLSRCDGKNCGQPSLSQELRYVVYIKSDR